MTSSNTYNFTVSNGEGVLRAYSRVRVRPPALTQQHMYDARGELNLMFVEWSIKLGTNLWKVELATLPLTVGVATYSIPSTTIMVLDAFITTTQGGSSNDRYITPISRTEYASFSNKTTPGPPTVYWFDRLISPTITVWPVPDSTGPFTFNYYRSVQIQDANIPGGETPDVPYRWLDAMVSGLAHRLSRIYAPDLEAMREKDAMKAWDLAAAQDTEPVPLYVLPAIGAYYRR